jgi:hypothetical protein
VQRDPLLGLEDEAGLRPEASARDGDVQCARQVAGGKGLGGADVEDRDVVPRGRPERWLGGQERAAVQVDDSLHVRGSGRGRAGGAVHELLHRRDREHRVAAPLGPDRRRGRGAHSGAAERAGDVAREDAHSIGQLEHAMQAPEEAFAAFPRLDGQVGSRHRPDEEGIPGEQRPLGEEAAVLGPVPRRVQAPDPDRAGLDLVAVGERVVRIRDAGVPVNGDGHVVLEGEPPVPGDMVGVRVRLQNARDPEAELVGFAQVLLDRVRGIDEHGLAGLLVSDEVGGTAQVLVDELPEQHRGPDASTRSRCLS